MGKAFKEPTFFENFANSAFVIGNPDLEPERSTSWEVGAEQSLFEGRALLGATYFDQHFRDLVQYTPMPANPGDPNYFNVAAADASGLEVEARGRVSWFEVDGNYTRLNTEVTDILRPEKNVIAGGERYSYDKLILSLGASPITPSIPGLGGRNEFTLSTDLADGRVLEKIHR